MPFKKEHIKNVLQALPAEKQAEILHENQAENLDVVATKLRNESLIRHAVQQDKIDSGEVVVGNNAVEELPQEVSDKLEAYDRRTL